MSDDNFVAVSRRMQAVGEFVQSTLAYAVLLLVVGLVAASVVVPRLSGAVPYTVLTSSMTPTYPAGTLIIVRSVPVEALGIGDVITYQVESEKPAVVTHRVIGVGYSASGERTFRTQGDNNGSPDEKAVRAVQVRGEVWYAIPLLGHVNTWVTGSREPLVNIAVSVLLGYAAWTFVSGSRKPSKVTPRRAVPSGVGQE